MGLAQPSMDYDVDSNPEEWTERLRVKGFCGLWALARWIHYRQPWSLYNASHVLNIFFSVYCLILGPPSDSVKVFIPKNQQPFFI